MITLICRMKLMIAENFGVLHKETCVRLKCICWAAKAVAVSVFVCKHACMHVWPCIVLRQPHFEEISNRTQPRFFWGDYRNRYYRLWLHAANCNTNVYCFMSPRAKITMWDILKPVQLISEELRVIILLNYLQAFPILSYTNKGEDSKEFLTFV
jgi:hypothetical protein